jgi:hypothetical protein
VGRTPGGRNGNRDSRMGQCSVMHPERFRSQRGWVPSRAMASNVGTGVVGVVMIALGLVVASDVRGINERWMRLPWPLAILPRHPLVYRASGAVAIVIGLAWVIFAVA